MGATHTLKHKDVIAKKLPILADVLWEWLGVMDRYVRLSGGDLPWWYNERASISVFAGAVWRTGERADQARWQARRAVGCPRKASRSTRPARPYVPHLPLLLPCARRRRRAVGRFVRTRPNHAQQPPSHVVERREPPAERELRVDRRQLGGALQLRLLQ
jgi:hypothetical protein